MINYFLNLIHSVFNPVKHVRHRSQETKTRSQYTVLTPEQVKEIERVFNIAPNLPNKKLAEQFNCSVSTISRIKNHKHQHQR